MAHTLARALLFKSDDVRPKDKGGYVRAVAVGKKGAKLRVGGECGKGGNVGGPGPRAQVVEGIGCRGAGTVGGA